MPCEWTRPPQVPLPSVWRRVEGRRPTADGRLPVFVIQDVTAELDEAVLDHMCEHFLREEPLCATTRLYDDPVSLRELRALWARMLTRRTALVALLAEPGGGAPRIAGANVTFPTTPGEKDNEEQYEGVKMRKVLSVLHHVDSLIQPDVFTRYSVSCYLYAMGLSVDPEFRGQGLGKHLLEARWDLCRAVGLQLTVTLFTARASQVLAERAGFETLIELRYDEYGDAELATSSTPTMKLMAARIT